EAALAAELEGDAEQAARCTAKAAELGDALLAPIFAERHARLGQNVDAVVARMEAEAEAEAEPDRRVERWLRVATIESIRDPDRALEILRMALAERPDHLPTLHAITAVCRRAGITDGFGGVALAVARQLPDGDGAGHAALA